MTRSADHNGLDSYRPRASVIVPAYNSETTIGGCLRALQNQTYPRQRYEIIVVDDGSEDKTAEVALETGAKVISPGKLGRSGARNLGAQKASGEIILFTDSDCEPISTWIELMIAPLQDREVAGVKGAYWSRQQELVARFTQVEVEERYRRMAQRDSINFVDTYAACYRRDIFLAHNGFDESVFVDEDQELSFRLSRRGYKMVFVPNARVFHLHTASVGHYFRRKFEIATWKPLLIKRYPERMISDSRTPQALKIQMGLVLMIIFLAPAGLFSSTARRALAAAILSFLAACLPFIRHAVEYDRDVTIITIPMLWLRAVALAIGYLNGMIRFRSQK